LRVYFRVVTRRFRLHLHLRCPPRPAPPRPAPPRRQGSVRYAELHCHSNFSFLDGASHPEELVEEAARIGLEALALTDHNGFYGIVRFARAARATGLRTVFGAELTLAPEESLARQSPDGGSRRQSSAGSDSLTRTGPADPKGRHLLVLARDPQGYALLARAISEGQLAGSKNAPRIDYERLVELGGAGTGDHWVVLSGCRKGAVPAALVNEGPAAAARALERLVADFGRPNVVVELWDHGLPIDSVRNDGLAALAVSHRLKLIASGNVHHHSVARQRLAAAMAAVRARRSLDEIDGWLPPASRHLRSGVEQAARFARYPGVVSEAAALGVECAFDLKLIAPNLPHFPCPDGLDEMGYLRRLVDQGGTGRYGPRSVERVPGARAQLDKELGLIEQLGFPGLFLVVYDIVEFCRRSRILCQGRGSVANSAVCFALGVTNADASRWGCCSNVSCLLNVRARPTSTSTSRATDEKRSSVRLCAPWPSSCCPSRQRDLLQVQVGDSGHGQGARLHPGPTGRLHPHLLGAPRRLVVALGYTPGQQDAFTKQVDRWRPVPERPGARAARRAQRT